MPYAISSQVRIGVYDCLYVALAERENCDLITADDKLIKALQGTFSFISALIRAMRLLWLLKTSEGRPASETARKYPPTSPVPVAT